MLIDLHSHSTLSDGTRSIEDMVLAAQERGYTAYAITDHVRGGDPSTWDVLVAVRDEIQYLRTQTPMRLFVGTELTDFGPEAIPGAARRARALGAEVVVVHGECVSLNVYPGTNAAAARCEEVDILGHPGLITLEDATEARRHGVHLELSAILGASYANGHVCWAARYTGAGVVVNSDAHDERGLLSHRKLEGLVRGSGAPDAYLHEIRAVMAHELINKIVCRPMRLRIAV